MKLLNISILLIIAFFVGFAEEIKYLNDEMEDFAKPAQGQLEAYNNRDIDEFMKWYSDQIVLKDFETNEAFVEGKSAMRDRYKKMFQEKVYLHCKLRNRIVCGDIVIDEELVTGLVEGQTVHATAIYKIENGLIVEAWFIRGR